MSYESVLVELPQNIEKIPVRHGGWRGREDLRRQPIVSRAGESTLAERRPKMRRVAFPSQHYLCSPIWITLLCSAAPGGDGTSRRGRARP